MLTPLEVLRRARRIVFVQVSEHEFLTITALADAMEVSWWVTGMREPLRSHHIDRSAEALDLFNGRAWNLELLATWVRRHCPVCWNVLTSSRQTYDTDKCKQKAYRQRKKMNQRLTPTFRVIDLGTEEEVEGAFVLTPQTDIHARSALLAYADSADFENPAQSRDLRQWVKYLNATFPIQADQTQALDPDIEWMRHQ